MTDQNVGNTDRVDTVNDISKACHMALSILNDLLNYDKLEDGTLLIEPMRVVALPFILNCTEVLYLQAKEKGLILTFDLESNNYDVDNKSPQRFRDADYPPFDSFDVNSTEMSFLSDSDYINVDPYKMNQVIGNLLSNAIKFTPAGHSVIIKARKYVPDTRWASYPGFPETIPSESNASEKSKNHSSFQKIMDYFLFSLSSSSNNKSLRGNDKDKDKDQSSKDDGDVNDVKESLRSSKFLNFAPSNSGYLILEVIDSGVGMAPEDSKRLFKEIVQFNPSKLQVLFVMVYCTTLHSTVVCHSTHF